MNLLKWLKEPDGNGYPNGWGVGFILITIGGIGMLVVTIIFISHHVRIV